MPVIGIVAAGFAISTAATGIAAAGLTLMTSLEVVGAVGATLGAIGQITHDKGLSTAGMILGGIGGIGSLAASAGLFGADAATAPLFGTGGDAAAAASDVAGAAPLGASVTESSLPDIVTSLQPGAVAQVTGTSVASGVAAPAGIIGTNFKTIAPLMDDAGNPAADALSSAANPIQSGSALATPPVGVASPAGATPSFTGAGSPAAPVTGAPAAPSSFAPIAPGDPAFNAVNVTPPVSSAATGPLAGIMDFANKNPAITLGTIQAAGSFLSGATSTLTPAQVAAYNAQAAANNAAAKQTNLQTGNMGQPLPVASRTPTGLINQGATA